MRFLSLDDNEVGVIAIGAAPVGILAIGATPVGIVAIGVGAVGVLALSVGAGAGIVSVSCGAGAGVFATGVGCTLGLKASSIGFDISVLPRERYPRREKRAPSEFENVAPDAIAASDFGRSGDAVEWVFVAPRRGNNGEWELAHDEEAIEVTPDAQRTLAQHRTEEGAVLARLSAELVPGHEPAGYREPPKPRRRLRCDRILLPPPIEPNVDRDLASRRRGWIGKLIFKGALLLGTSVGVLGLVTNRLADLDLTRTAETTWHGKLRRTEGMVFPNDTRCTVHGRMRSNGKDRTLTELEITCGHLVIYPRLETRDCQVSEGLSVSKKGRVYRLACRIESAEPTDDSKGHPSLEIDTNARTATIVQPLPSPFRVEIDLEETSDARTGEPLFVGN